MIRARISLCEDVPLHVVGDGVVAIFAQTVQIVIREALVLALQVVRALCQVACVGSERIALVQNHRVRRVLCRALGGEAIGIVLVGTRHRARFDLRHVAQGILCHALIHHRSRCGTIVLPCGLGMVAVGISVGGPCKYIRCNARVEKTR